MNDVIKFPGSQEAQYQRAWERFTAVIQEYDALNAAYHELWSASCCPLHYLGRPGFVDRADIQRYAAALAIGGEGELKKIWPRQNIHAPNSRHISQRLGLMIGAFPGGGPHATEIFARMMLTHVMAEHPSVMVLESTCRELETTMKFVPAITEVLEVLRRQQKKWKRRLEVDKAIADGRARELAAQQLARLDRYDELSSTGNWSEATPEERGDSDYGSLERHEWDDRWSNIENPKNLAYRMSHNDPLRVDKPPELSSDEVNRLLAKYEGARAGNSDDDEQDVPDI